MIIVDLNAGSEHSYLLRAIVLAAIATAFVTRASRVQLRTAWMVASLVLSASALLAVLNRLVTLVGAEAALPSHSTVHLHLGIWLAIIGLVLVAVSTIVRVASRSVART